jgi:hypothetical protein
VCLVCSVFVSHCCCAEYPDRLDLPYYGCHQFGATNYLDMYLLVFELSGTKQMHNACI